MNNHDILGTNDSWTKNAIRKQFKLLSLKIHPDKSGSSELFKIVHIAYDKIMSGEGNDPFVYLPLAEVVNDDLENIESLRIQVYKLLEEVKIKTSCLDEANAQIRQLSANSDVTKIAGQLKLALTALFVMMVCGAIVLMTSFGTTDQSMTKNSRFVLNSVPKILPEKPKLLLKSTKRNWKSMPGYSKSGDFGEFILITELGIPTLKFQIDKTLYTNQQKAQLRNEKHGSCQAALDVDGYQRVGLINPFAQATIGPDYVFSIWLFDSVDLAMFQDFETLTLICDDLTYRAKLQPAQ